MTGLLIRLFIKNSSNTENSKVREAYGTLAGAVGIAANTLLCAAKFIIGVVTGSVAVQADAVNNMADIGSNVVTLMGARLAGRPADKEHPYGHARMEYLAALVIAFLILLVGFQLGKESIGKIINPTAVEFTPVSMLVLAISIGVKLWMGLFTANIGRRIDSATMSAATADSICDCISTGAILISSFASYFWKINLDGYIGVLVAAFVLYSGIKIVRETISPLMGEAPDPELIKELETRLTGYKDILDTHDILIHSYGPGAIIASAHAEVPASCNVLDMHEIIDRAEMEIGRDMGMMLTIHMDPVEIDNPAVNDARALVSGIISEYDGKVRFHDFRMVPGEQQSNLIFDIVVPAGTNAESSAAIVRNIRAKVKEDQPTYACVIKVDHDYSGSTM